MDARQPASFPTNRPSGLPSRVTHTISVIGKASRWLRILVRDTHSPNKTASPRGTSSDSAWRFSPSRSSFWPRISPCVEILPGLTSRCEAHPGSSHREKRRPPPCRVLGDRWLLRPAFCALRGGSEPGSVSSSAPRVGRPQASQLVLPWPPGQLGPSPTQGTCAPSLRRRCGVVRLAVACLGSGRLVCMAPETVASDRPRQVGSLESVPSRSGAPVGGWCRGPSIRRRS